MRKKLPVVNCGECIHRNNQGIVGPIVYIPCCNSMNKKELPYTTMKGPVNGIYYAEPTQVIPEWCPLEDY